MALRSLTRAGVEMGGKVARKGKCLGAVTHRVGAERQTSSWVGQGQGHFGRSQPSSYRQGSLAAGTQLFKLVETDLMSKELTRYGPSDAEHLGLHSIQDVLSDIAAATSALPEPIVAVTEASAVEVEHASEQEESPAAPAAVGEEVLAAWGLGPSVPDIAQEGSLEAPQEGEGAEILAIKRTYQPSTIKRKRRHGFLYRAKTRLGKKILQRRQDKGRWRLGI